MTRCASACGRWPVRPSRPPGQRVRPAFSSPSVPSDRRTSVRLVLEREALEAMLAEGCSLEEIGRRVERHPSTVAYWLRKHGLDAAHRLRHLNRGGIAREQLLELVAADFTVREI